METTIRVTLSVCQARVCRTTRHTFESTQNPAGLGGSVRPQCKLRLNEPELICCFSREHVKVSESRGTRTPPLTEIWTRFWAFLWQTNRTLLCWMFLCCFSVNGAFFWVSCFSLRFVLCRQLSVYQQSVVCGCVWLDNKPPSVVQPRARPDIVSLLRQTSYLIGGIAKTTKIGWKPADL